MLALYTHIISDAKAQAIRLPAVGACIYCRRTRAAGIQLEKEHIIPDGIGGDLILPEASCRDCARIINPVETRVQNGFFGTVRAVGGFRSKKRRGKAHPKPAGFRFLDGPPEGWIPEAKRYEKVRFKEVPISDEMAHGVIYEVFRQRPAILTGATTLAPLGHGFALPESEKERAAKHGPQRILFRFRGSDFHRMIAKVAHAYAVASVGLDGFNPYLVGFILGRDAQNQNYFFGSLPLPVQTNDAHWIGLAKAEAYGRSPILIGTFRLPVYVVHLQLFAPYNTPVYEIVVGTVRNA